MKRILFGLLVAGVALSASAFTTFTPYTFYNTGVTALSVDPAEYVYVPGGLCATNALSYCSITIDVVNITPVSGNTTLADVIVADGLDIDLSETPEIIEPGKYTPAP